MWTSFEKCWVPNCPNSRDRGYAKNFFPLPTAARYKEIWLALAGKKSTGMEELIYFCQDHFDPSVIETYMDKFVCLNATATPYYNMPERICRTCMTTIMDGEVFSVLSATIACTIPGDIKSELLTCRPEPLLQVLNFCIPELNLCHDPLPLTCYRCYHNIWLFYIFKLTCNAVEKERLGKMNAAAYGKVVLCRSCPVNSGTNFFNLEKESAMGKLLRKMFLNHQPVEVLPLNVCLKCWNTLYKLEKFYLQCMTVEQKMHRRVMLSQNRLINAVPPLPITMTPPPSYKAATNPLREYRKSTHPYPATSVQSGLKPETAVEKSDAIPSTSITNFNGKQQQCNELKLRLKKKFEISDSTVNLGASSSSYSCTDSNSGASKSDETDDEDDAQTKDPKDSTGKKRLTLLEKTALAKLMLKHGQPLKTDTSPKIHFEAWVSIVREFHELGYERSLEDIQKTWKGMKRKAETAFITPGSTTELNRLVIDYLKDIKCNSSELKVAEYKIAGKIDEPCEVICIDDDDDANENEKDLKKEVSEPPQTEQKPQVGSGEVKEEPIKVKTKKKNINMKPKDLRHQNRDYWDQDRKLALVRNMRMEYDTCLKNNELTTGKAPWKMILQRLLVKGCYTCKFQKLSSVWSKMKMSATIHEKDGSDQVDEEVWDMLQIQNAVQKSVNKDASPSSAEKATEKRQSGGGQGAGKSNDRNLPPSPQGPTNVSESTIAGNKAKVTALDNKAETTASNNNKQSKNSAVPPVNNPNTGAYKNRRGRPLNPNKKWSEEEKMTFFKLIKVECILYLKSKEPVFYGIWRKLINRVYENGYNSKSNEILYQMWHEMRTYARTRENVGSRMSMLDQKIMRLVRLVGKYRVPKNSLSTKTPAVVRVAAKEVKKLKTVKKEATNETPEAQVKKTASDKAPKEAKDRRSAKKEAADEAGDSTGTISDKDSSKITVEQKTDLISIIKAYGVEVFKTRRGGTPGNQFWPKVTADFNSKGNNWELPRVRCLWQNLLYSAKNAWADQKQPNQFDKLIIDFMTETIQKKDIKCEENDKEDGEEEDDCFDEISERMSENSPQNAASDNEKEPELNYDYVSLADLEKGYEIIDKNVKTEFQPVKCELALPFKIESYTSEQVIEISDED